MSVHELLDLVVYNPFFLTDAYYVEIGSLWPKRWTAIWPRSKRNSSSCASGQRARRHTGHGAKRC
jgi:hypothetical protein